MHINLLRFKKLLTVFIIFVAVAAAYLALIRPATVFAQTSCSDACSSGQKRCSGSGYQTCGNYDSDYCYEWSGVYSCSTGYKCQNGSCVKSCSDACSSGSRRCSGSGYQTCVKGSSGCYVWSSVSNCSAGYKCQNGSCVKSCSDACSSGAKRCSSTSGYQTCVKGSGGCYVWSAPYSCSTGYKCQNGSCVRSCSDTCSSGARKCSGTSAYQTCVKNSQGCYAWSSATNCSTGYKCQNGSCVKSCSDACSSGAKKCSGTNTYQTCVKSSTGCYAWGSSTSCSTGYKCQNGSCVKSCSDTCSAGSKKCSGTTAYQTCVKGSSGCYAWSSASNCSTGYKCQNGSCVKSCSDACSSGSRRCSGSGYQTCVKGSSGCYVWSSVSNCSAGYKCSNGSCVKSCSDACTMGEKKCSGNSAYQTCVKSSQGCYIWGSAVNCAANYKCQNGSCVKSCSDICGAGEKRCVGTTSYQTCAMGLSGCYVWKSAVNCSFGYKCENGSCVKSCSDECASGEKQCSGDTSYQTCVKNSQGCYVWGSPKNCSTGYKCQNGSCVRSCSDECSSGAKQCFDDSSYQTCFKNSAGCYVWGTPKACATGYKCLNGSCVSSCSDECVSGEKECSDDDSYRVCGNYDSDKCTEWGTPKNCSFGYKCQNGSCVKSCSDECAPGQKECSTDTAYRICGKYDLDSCYEWSEDKECATGYNCQNGSCVKGCTDQCTSGDHQCSGTSGRTCGNYDSDSCTEWSGYEKCDDQCFYCGDGKCNSDCGETKNTCSEDCGADKPTVELTGPASVSCKGSATISWTSTKADTCTASGGWSGTKDTSGSETIDGIIAKKTFSLACTGPGGKASDSITVSVDIVSPQANAGGDKQVDENDETGLDGSGSAAGYDSDDLVYVWTCNGGSLDNADTAQPTFNAQEVSRDTVYTCTLKVTNNCNKTDSDTVNVVVKNKIAGQFAVDLSASPDSGCAPLNNVDLTARIVDIEGDKDSKYTYYFSCEGDGEWDKTITTSATSYTAKDLCDYGDEGEYQSEVKVEGSESGEEATDSVMVEVDDCGREFTVRLEVEPSSGCKPVNNVDLTAAITDDSNRDSDDYTYRFDCDDDGEWEKTITTSSDRYTAKDLCDYDSTGTHTAKVIVEAGEGEATDKADVNVKSCGGKEFNVNLTASPDSGCAPLDNVDLTAHITGYDNDGDIEYTYYFDCDDDDDWDKKMTTEDTSYTARNLCDYDDADDYTARVKVESNGQFDEDTVKINTDDCENGEGDLKVEKTVSNLSRGAGYLDSVNARPGDFVSFKISIEAVSDNVENLTLSDVLPDGLIDIRDIEIDGRPNRGDIENGLDLDDLNEGDEVVVTFIATVDNASSFHYGQTTITNTVTARGEGASDSDEADIIVQRAEIAGITAISTGFTDNPFLDSFVIPLGLSLFGVWALKAKLLAIEEFLDAWKIAFAKFHSQKSLAAKISQLKIKHIATRFK